MRKVSKKRAAQLREYKRIRIRLLSCNPICPVTGDPATEIHHMKGRVGDLLTDVRYMLPVSRKGHIWIETHPVEAKEKGWSLSRLSKNDVSNVENELKE